jgi:hypothetical protein|tara:strand:- start:343 stop:615 length:273 start_codon:yes stop_codon:yes gene_type:complete
VAPSFWDELAEDERTASFAAGDQSVGELYGIETTPPAKPKRGTRPPPDASALTGEREVEQTRRRSSSTRMALEEVRLAKREIEREREAAC